MSLQYRLRLHLKTFLKIGVPFLAIPLEWNDVTDELQYIKSKWIRIAWFACVFVKLSYFANLVCQMAFDIATDKVEPTIILTDMIYTCVYGIVILFLIFFIFELNNILDLVKSFSRLEKCLQRILGYPHPKSLLLNLLSNCLPFISFFIGSFASLSYLVHPNDSRYMINIFSWGKVSKNYIILATWSIFEGYIGISCSIFFFTLCILSMYTAYFFYIWCRRFSDESEYPHTEEDIKTFLLLFRIGNIYINLTNNMLHYFVPIAMSFGGVISIITLYASIKFCKKVYMPYYFAIPIFSLISLAVFILFLPFVGKFNSVIKSFIVNWKPKAPTLALRKQIEAFRPYGLQFGSIFIFKKSTGITFLLIILEQTINIFITFKNYDFRVTVSELF